MKMVKMIIDNKEIEVQLTDEQIKELTTLKKVTGFEKGCHYFYVDPEGDITSGHDENDISSNYRYEVANYYTDGSVAEWCRCSDNLTRKMRRWAAEHNAEPVDLYDNRAKWYLTWDIRTKTVEVYFNVSSIDYGKVFFKTEETAKAAIKEFGDEIKWLAENRPKWF